MTTISSKPCSIAQNFLLLGERAEVSLAAPVAARAADPGVEHAAAVELHVVAQPVDEIDELRLGLVRRDLVRHLERHRHDRAGIVGQRRAREQNQVRAALQAPDDFGRGLLARKLAEELLDVLNLERALLEVVLGDVIFHVPQLARALLASILAQVSRSETVRLKTSAPGRESGSTQK